MKLLITGATGFVGRHVVAAALQRGHKVRAVVRPAGTTDAFGALVADDALETAQVDLRSPKGVLDAVDGVDSVIHLAAAKAGDFYSQFAGTVTSTENLLSVMGEVGVRQLVAVSTFSVYDYRNMRSKTLLDEDAPIDVDPEQRDEYARTKLLQEELYRTFGTEPDHRVVILRPGMIYGRDELWHPLLGAEIGPLFVRIGHGGVMPMIYVENAAEAMVLAAERLGDDPSPVDGEVINLVDDDLPSQQGYIDEVSKVIEVPRTVSVKWPMVRAAARLLEEGNDRLVKGRAKFPGIVVPDKLHGRFKPLHYTNAKAKRLLDWTPRYGLDEAIRRSVAPEAEVFVAVGDDDAAAGDVGVPPHG
ncbi:MAG: NAD(P)-dependent oxidoreductase [Actinomycetota bacterium]